MTKAGEKQIKDLKLSSEEITAMQMALDGSLDKEHNKRGKITKPVLCSLLQKIIPVTKWFEQSTTACSESLQLSRRVSKGCIFCSLISAFFRVGFLLSLWSATLIFAVQWLHFLKSNF